MAATADLKDTEGNIQFTFPSSVEAGTILRLGNVLVRSAEVIVVSNTSPLTSFPNDLSISSPNFWSSGVNLGVPIALILASHNLPKTLFGRTSQVAASNL